MSKELDKAQLEQELKNLDGWSVEDDKLTKQFSFSDFREAMSFMVRVAFEAEELGHHPELFNVYKDVRIQLATHDAGGKITNKDTELAKRIDAI
ncbi:4a-hydroxytetrahydrobiopterin dehydratase [Natronogracilivirga saccharolytica]|uniref:Putative pterin-4-alpha-carbinolamine dehydratase n=1 Tax=Natronogracilivirga saccharolytica TaxID=2812953 RepID=A0A8J7S8J3_9BACT|nr:4a-hydroxytetrahydrobiopterin dehydratase [Natronogracilivirga saccharolytica]MBP3192221.1 4a-hydroxytetrahydrobiopterin dehydratase [Natronogracilivirga saccharolytica]